MEQESKARVRRRARARALKSLLAAGVVCCGWWTPRRAVANLSVERARAGETARWRARERRGGKRSVLSGEQSRSLNGAPFKLGFRCRVEDSAHTFSVQVVPGARSVVFGFHLAREHTLCLSLLYAEHASALGYSLSASSKSRGKVQGAG